jgi:hypothetical protein
MNLLSYTMISGNTALIGAIRSTLDTAISHDSALENFTPVSSNTAASDEVTVQDEVLFGAGVIIYKASWRLIYSMTAGLGQSDDNPCQARFGHASGSTVNKLHVGKQRIWP